MNKTQIQTILAPVIGFVVAWLARKFPLLDQTTWDTLVSSVTFAGVAAVMGILTKKNALKDTVGSMPQTTVITDKASADALPNNPDVIAATPEIRAAINKAS